MLELVAVPSVLLGWGNNFWAEQKLGQWHGISLWMNLNQRGKNSTAITWDYLLPIFPPNTLNSVGVEIRGENPGMVTPQVNISNTGRTHYPNKPKTNIFHTDKWWPYCSRTIQNLCVCVCGWDLWQLELQ